jgi:hypothetical protein
MATATPSIGVIRAQIRAIRNKAPDARFFGIFTSGRWTAPTLQGDGSEQIAVFQCDSPLQMRLALQETPATSSATVLITPLDQTKISDDILLRLAMRRLYPINSWEIVRSLFKAQHLDPRITRYPFLADLLLEHAAGREFQAVAGGLVDAETVWDILFVERLGLSGGRPDLVELLRRSADADLARRWQACSPEFQIAAGEWIVGSAGDAAAKVLRCLQTEHGAKALVIGLVMGVVYHDSVGHELDKAAGRLEAYVGVTPLPAHVARRWRDAAAACSTQLPRPMLRRCMDEAESILENIEAASFAWRSGDLDSGFEQRLGRFAAAMTAHIDTRATAISDELQNILASVQQHRLARDGGRRMERVAMAIRLARWLADQNAQRTATSSGLLGIARDYAANGGFVDWARRVLRGGEPNKDLAACYVRLVDRVTELREAENQRFGQALVEQKALGDPNAGLIPVEQAVEKVVATVAASAPVLVLLIDGMSWAVYRELISDVKSHDWIEMGPSPQAKRLIGLAALPSVTEVCRTSLFCGQLRRGQAADEVRGFAEHPALVEVSQAGSVPKLFHKAALEGDEDTSLARDIRLALADRKQRVVGIVINAVDDHLDKGDQIDAIWTMQHIRVLEPILAEASAAGRIVVMLSDHGHILDRQTEGREGLDGHRWRRPGGSLTNEELAITSSRVVKPEGGSVVVPWSERLRYGTKKNGYHGGITPQEMLIPISILWPELKPPAGFDELPVDFPAWWMEPMAASPAAVVAAATPWKQTRDKSKQPTLFDQPKVPVVKQPAEEPWINQVLKSEVFAAQKRLAGRVRVDEAAVQQLIAILVSRGGSMTAPALAGALGVPDHRLLGHLAIMQRLLNVEGYAILDRQDAANTIVLNVPLLKKQFEIA